MQQGRRVQHAALLGKAGLRVECRRLPRLDVHAVGGANTGVEILQKVRLCNCRMHLLRTAQPHSGLQLAV
jgi:hypothetical protein